MKSLAVERSEAKKHPVMISGEKKTHSAMTQATVAIEEDGIDRVRFERRKLHSLKYEAVEAQARTASAAA
jgi:hypothetical protein